MPTDAFGLMRDEFEQRRFSCVHVFNRARDGQDCWVFVTVAPLANGYLSVRVCPTNHAMLTPVKEICAYVWITERAYVEEGHGCREVAEYGTALLTGELTRLQHHNLHNFVRVTLPCELALLVIEGVQTPLCAELDNPVFAVLQTVAVIECNTDEPIYQPGEYQELINDLGPWVVGVRLVIGQAGHVGFSIGEVTDPDARSSAPTVSECVKERGAQAVEVLGQPNSSLTALYEVASEVRFRSSMMRLHALMAGIFATTVLGDQEGESGNATDDLAETMLSDLKELIPFCQETVNLTECLEGDLRSVVGSLDRVKWPFQHWTRALQDEGTRALVEGVDTETALDETVAVDEQGFPETASLAELAVKARGVAVTSGESVIRQRVVAVRGISSYLGE